MIFNKAGFCDDVHGVDSSVAAFYWIKTKYEVVGCFMERYNVYGCREADAEDADGWRGFKSSCFVRLIWKKNIKIGR